MHEFYFTKMNGAGNDFVLIDNRSNALALSSEDIVRLCDRHRGIGADGVLLAELPQTHHADLRMRYYNADGGEVEMCGNGARCFARFAAWLLKEKESRELTHISFETIAGIIKANLEGQEVCLAMSDPKEGKDLGTMIINGNQLHVHFINSGVPHVVVPVKKLDDVDVALLGAALRYHDRFAPQGTNVNFVRALGPQWIAIRTYERGVEAETLACGTGTVASALVYAEMTKASSPIDVQVQGGEILKISFERVGEYQYRNVTLTGPADFVFEGKIKNYV